MARRTHSFLVSLLLLPLLLSCSGRLVPSSIDVQHNIGESPGAVSPPLEIRKEFHLHSAPKQQMIRADNLIFVPTRTGRVEAYDLDREKRIGKMKFPNNSQAGLTLVDGRILISLEFGKESLILFDPKKNRNVWTAELGSISTSPRVVGNKVYVGSLYRGVFCLSLDSGSVRWQAELTSQLHQDPVVLDEVLVQGTESGELIAISLGSGETSWKRDLNSPVSAGLVAGQGRIIACTFDGRVLAYSDAGRILWERRIGTEVRRDVAVSRDWMILAGQDGSIRAIRLDNGEEVWRFETGTVIGTSPVLTPEYVVFGTLDKRLVFLSSETGEAIWELELYGRVRTDPVIWNDRLIVGSENNNLYIFDSAAMTH